MISNARAKQERLRRRYRPDPVRILFVGESPPFSGRFFYQQDSGLYRAIRDSFQAADPSIIDPNFLDRFRSAGCYLVDLCPDPVDQLDSQMRRAACVAAEPVLARTIQRLRPLVIVVVLRSILANVQRAADRAHWNGRLAGLPYPGKWARYRAIFITTLAKDAVAFLQTPYLSDNPHD